MKALLLSAPMKTSEEVNWLKPLNSYLLSVYGNTSEFQSDLKKINDLRKAVQFAADAVDVGTSVEDCLTYYSQLELLDLRVPISALSKRKAVKFTWADAFSSDVEHTQTALPFEKASVLFNLGSLLMKTAALKYSEASKTSSNELRESAFKDAMQAMQQAAGVFEYLSESFLHGPLSDLKPATVKFLKGLCLAQSQEIFTLRVIDGDLEQKKNSMISRLCASAAKYYDECHLETAHLANESNISAQTQYVDFRIKEAGLEEELLDTDGEDEEPLADYDPDVREENSTKVPARLNASWVAIFLVKHLYYKSLAYYFQGLQLEANKKFGESIAYLTRSSETLAQIAPAQLKAVAKSKGQNVYDLLDNLEYHKDALKIKLTDLTKDNDLIYHDIIPSLVMLAEPKALSSVKGLPLNRIETFVKINEKNYNQFLNNVVPISIHELLSFYSEEKSQFLRNELDAVDVSNEELSSALEFLNLPHALVSIKELINADKPLEYGALESRLDQASLRKVEEISSKYTNDRTSRNIILQCRKEIFDCVAKCEALLNSAPSNTSVGQLRDDLIKLKRSLYEAANSDARLFALIDEDNSAFYQALGKGVSSIEFQNLFQNPEAGGVGKSESQEPEVSLLDIDDSQLDQFAVRIEDKIVLLEDLLNSLNVIKANKTKLIAELKEEIHNDDISDILLINSRVKSTDEIKEIIFPEELKKFEAFLTTLNTLIGQQKGLMDDVKTRWDDLVSNPKVKDIQASSAFRNGLLSERKIKIDEFYEKNWKKYTAGLQRGAEFYQQLLEYARGLHGTVERQIQTGLITQSMGALNMSRDVTGGSVASHASQGTPQFSAAPRYDKAQPMWQADSYSVPPQDLGTQWNMENMGSSASRGNVNGQSFTVTAHAPTLPPKQPSQSSSAVQHGSFGAAPLHSPEVSGPQAKPAPAFGPGSSARGSGSGLIYDQPSTYQPDMYDYFAPRNS